MTGPIRGLIHAVCRQRRLIAASAAVAVAAGAAVSFLSPPIYRAEATVALFPLAGGSATEQRAGLATQAALFSRPEIQQPLIAALGPDALYPGLSRGMAAAAAAEAAAQSLGRSLRVEADPARLVLVVALEHPDPEVAATVDGVALVLAAERTRYAQAAAARDALLDSGANLLGAVLNQRRRYLPRFLEALGV